jgi:hypothetical protein
MTRCRQPVKNDDVEVFVVNCRAPGGDATVGILCEKCGKRFYTHPENRALAMEREMKVLCLSCALELAAREKEKFRIGGTVRKGKIIERPQES